MLSPGDGGTPRVQPVRLIAVAASTVRTMVLRITASGTLEHRWVPTDDTTPGWSDWTEAPFDGRIVDAAAISGWPQQIEISSLMLRAASGTDGGGPTEAGSLRRGSPTAASRSQRPPPLSLRSAPVMATSTSSSRPTTARSPLPHVNTFDTKWRQCPLHVNEMADGWWPAFDYTAADIIYRSP